MNSSNRCHKTPRLATLHLEICGTLILISLLFLLLSPAAAAPILKPPGTTGFKKLSSSASSTAAPLSDSQIDETISRIQSREEELRRQLLPPGITLLPSGVPNGATAEEYQEWQRLTARIVNLLDSRITNYRYIKDIRQSVRDLETSRKGWRGFYEKPPYPMTLVDSLQDAIRTGQIECRTHEVQLTFTDGEVEEYSSNLRESRAQVRLAQERLEKGGGTPGEERLRWLLAVAVRRNDLNEAGVISMGIQRQMLQEGLARSRHELDFLDQKLTHAMGNVSFTREELLQKLKGLDVRGEQVTKELENAIRAEESERTAQELARDTLQRFKESSSISTVTPRLVALRQALEVRQVRVETAGLKVLTLKVIYRLIQVERTAWESRYQITNRGDGRALPHVNEVRKDLASYQNWEEYLRSRMKGVENQIRSRQAQLTSSVLSEMERSRSRELLSAYQEQKEYLLRMEEQISGTEQLISRLEGEITARSGEERLVTGSVKRVWNKTLAIAGKIWSTELYVAEELVIIDGQKIIRPRSVTVGKLIQALLILFMGLFTARRVMKPMSRLAARKFSLDENDAHVFGRVTYYLLFICILLFSLVTVNIPLGFFAFFGGALAIGVGFGAQTLINNFISGLILLFDRTVRLNDVVEIDGQRGRIAAINIRSSRVKRFDGIEILVPNSHFLQQNVVNLTLSDPCTRYEIRVGVAYGTSTRSAEAVILRSVVEQPEVLVDPAPLVVFEDFADSSLDFRAFFWINLHPDVNGNVVRSEIRHRIGEYLSQAGIGIPFPQRDVQVSVSRPLEVKILGGGSHRPVDTEQPV